VGASLVQSATGAPVGALMPDEFEERDLVERAKEDPDAFGALYDRYFPQIYRFTYSRVRDQSLAEDVTSEVFFKALKNMKRYTYTGHPFSSWLYQIAVNAVADHYRGPRGKEVELEEGASMPSAEPMVVDQVVRRDRSRRVWAAIDQLPQQQRTAMILKFAEDKKIEDIAVIMQKSAGAVKLLLHRGVERLRRELPPELEEGFGIP
jgi:RNA polymerase sigma-70 factor, ECF subfamily